MLPKRQQRPAKYTPPVYEKGRWSENEEDLLAVGYHNHGSNWDIIRNETGLRRSDSQMANKIHRMKDCLPPRPGNKADENNKRAKNKKRKRDVNEGEKELNEGCFSPDSPNASADNIFRKYYGSDDDEGAHESEHETDGRFTPAQEREFRKNYEEGFDCVEPIYMEWLIENNLQHPTVNLYPDEVSSLNPTSVTDNAHSVEEIMLSQRKADDERIYRTVPAATATPSQLHSRRAAVERADREQIRNVKERMQQLRGEKDIYHTILREHSTYLKILAENSTRYVQALEEHNRLMRDLLSAFLAE